YTQIEGVTYDFEIDSFAATAGAAGEVTFTGTAPSNAITDKIRIYRVDPQGGTFSPGQSGTEVFANQNVEPGAAFTIAMTGATSGSFDFYGVPMTALESLGTASGPEAVTIT
ncbi:MAG: hypothetical protein AAGP08_15230, partial [Pseudomonadota bacterium]